MEPLAIFGTYDETLLVCLAPFSSPLLRLLVPSSLTLCTARLISPDDFSNSQTVSAAVPTEPLNIKDTVDPLVNPGVPWTGSASVPDAATSLVSEEYAQVHAFGLAGEVILAAHSSTIAQAPTKYDMVQGRLAFVAAIVRVV
ncbi:hypothetical protein CORC01_08696 [Colletotrichum orchidophilum]|uniref:Uncharacterized protein n=1 Tax=Colletotrichum orchidophilum TaxID=1209926 RepID=A0A1G4B3T5_9PEZI|nr:uncharacterized protein CORC01_08696 [Colletotrichum orchidophilum]OHE96003.1 hypothetical protein CORC01_08696 [Colletotrichum orchidophilum]